MIMEDYKKKYDELLLKLQKAKVDDNVCDEMYYRVIDNIVPELKESEDERIRKELIAFLKEMHETGRAEKTWSLSGIERWIAWLEKQGKQVSAIRWYDAFFIPQEMKELLVEWNSSDATWHDVAFYHADTKTFWNYERELKNVTRWCYVDDLFGEQKPVNTNYPQFTFDDVLAIQHCMEIAEKVQKDKELYEALSSLHGKVHDVYHLQKEQKLKGKSALEAINEEKVDNANKVEPKSEFKVGDWIVHNSSNTLYKIVAFNSGYCSLIDIEGTYYNPCICPNGYYHLWTLSDVKNGGILYSSSLHLIWIYKDNETAHICVNMNYVKDNVFTEGLIVIPEDACPATKEQRELLFSKMKEAGYEWDADKKELRNIEQKPTWSEEDEKNLLEIKCLIGSYRAGADEYRLDSWIDSFKDRVQPQNGIVTDEELIQAKREAYNEALDKIEYHSGEPTFDDGWSAAIWYFKKRNIQPQPKQEWSEEDENLLKLSFENLTELKDRYGEEYGKVGDCISWLKSLKDRHTWKPSEEQLDALQYVYRNLNPPLSDKLCWNSLKTLELMYHDLEKLK